MEMVSIRRFMDRTAAAGTLHEACTQLRQAVREALEQRRQSGPEFVTREFEGDARELARRLEEDVPPLETVSLAAAALEVLEEQSRHAVGNLREQSGQMQAMVGMLTETVADISGLADASVARLHEIERQIERVTSLENMRELKAALEQCLAAVKEAAVEQRSAAQSAVDRLREQARKAVEHGAADGPAEYVAAFRLQRSEHILSRFGKATADQMTAMMGEGLKTALGPNDRLTPWKGSCFVMFLHSRESLAGIRRRLTVAVARIGQKYVEVGNSALLAVGVDWTVFPQAEHASLDAVMREVESFAAGKGGNGGSKA